MNKRKLEIGYARRFLKKCLNRTTEYVAKGFPTTGIVTGKDWEVFTAILLNDMAAKNYRGNGCGADLRRHEVKSGCIQENGSVSYEYQYQSITGLTKMKEETELVDHVYIPYKPGYKDFEIWWVSVQEIREYVEENDWRGKYRRAYIENDRQRCRPTLPHSQVRERGKLILKIVNNKIVLPIIK